MARIGVVLSSGFFGFFAHAGFLAALRGFDVEPSGYAGASSGAIVAAMAASGMGDHDIKKMLFNIRKEDFWDPDPWRVIIPKAFALFKGYRGYLKGERFAQLLRKIPADRIEECRTPLAVSAANLTQKRETIFTSGNLARAVRASGAVPVLFKPVEIGGSMYVDGGLVNKAPVQALADLIQPEKIFVHYIESGDMGGTGNAFLRRKITPWHIHQLSVNISRQEAYKRQCDMVREKGIEVIEVRVIVPSLGPNKMGNGPLAYKKAKEETQQILQKLM